MKSAQDFSQLLHSTTPDCSSLCRRVAHVKPKAVGGVEHALVICEEGLEGGKAVEDSDSVVLRLGSAEEVGCRHMCVCLCACLPIVMLPMFR